jgi:hypothetical protein
MHLLKLNCHPQFIWNYTARFWNRGRQQRIAASKVRLQTNESSPAVVQETWCSELDPCLFIWNDIICSCYADDLFFFYRDHTDFWKIIQSFIDNGNKFNWEHTVEGEVKSFLDITINQNSETGSFKFTQYGLIKITLKAGDRKPFESNKMGTTAAYHKTGAMLLQSEWWFIWPGTVNLISHLQFTNVHDLRMHQKLLIKLLLCEYVII